MVRASQLLRAALVSSCVLATPACDDDADPGPNNAGSSGQGIGCANDPRVTAFAAGMQAKSSSDAIAAEIVNASPSPPQRGPGDGGFNTWTLKLTANGAPPPASSVTVKTLMPDHGHGSARVPTVTDNGDGTYQIGDLYFFMAGVWTVSFSVNPQDTATFTICVE